MVALFRGQSLELVYVPPFLLQYSRIMVTSTTMNTSRVEGLLYISAWIVLSSIVIVFNKWILGRFPFSITLTTWHMLFATVATQIISRTTSLIQKSPDMNPRFYIKAILPIGICFSVSLILSNVVYLYLSMSFIQMLKSIGPVATLLACWSMGIRNPEPSMQVLLTVIVIVLGVAISSIGELRFVLTGFLIQGAAVVFEAYKNALQQFLLSGKTKMSSMTLLYYFAPACTVMNAFWILIFELKGLQEKGAKSGIGMEVWLLNGFICFGLNIASVTVIKKTSSVVLTLSGIPKSILLSVMDMMVYHTSISMIQTIGFSIAGAGTYYYSQLTNAPKPAAEYDEKRIDPPLVKKFVDEEAQLLEK
ncbi:triose-phosphate transporter family-domain-containing protein [Bisporella sp. PMI_857]|nr:triose-phosphate transporter family-domain-containing protein [Bisporella sp. PMI_857]